jgi:cell division septation protein DedD
VKLFSKKTNQEPLKTLNEREIQERLYGKYHADSPKVSATASVRTATLPKIEVKNRLEPSFSSQPSRKTASLDFASPVIKFFKAIPWKFAGLMLGSLVGIIFVLQILSSWMGSLKEESVSSRIKKSAAEFREVAQVKIEKASIPALGVKAETEAIQPIAETKPITPKAAAFKKKYYAVQVCTYFQESDAKELTQKLNHLNFSAFYQRVYSNAQNTSHYLVFLGKEETQSAAQAQFQAFKKSPEFQSFPDSFVRSI